MVRTLVLVLLVLALTVGVTSIRQIEAGEIAVRVNLLTGSEETIATEGVSLAVPFVHEIFIIDATPQTVTLQGDLTTEDFVTKQDRLESQWQLQITLRYEF
jgi:regulator of protease activity HflC (stomatin/prohibitin superfamily)